MLFWIFSRNGYNIHESIVYLELEQGFVLSSKQLDFDGRCQHLHIIQNQSEQKFDNLLWCLLFLEDDSDSTFRWLGFWEQRFDYRLN